MPNKCQAIIVGAGIGGLTLSIALRRFGHAVTILEQAKQLSEVGAGIQLAPNATRILDHLGILPAVAAYADKPSGLIARRYSNDAEIGPHSHSGTQARFGFPMLVIHRADLQRVLLAEAQNLGVNIRAGARVQTVDHDFAAAVTLSSGEKVTGNVLVGADGIKSVTRSQLASSLGCTDTCTTTGDSAYRVTIPRDKLADEPDILKPLDQGKSTRWLGPGGHVMAYPLRGGQLYNVVMIHAASNGDPDNRIDLWSHRDKMQELLDFYGSWGPMIHRLVDRIDGSTLIQWPLNQRSHLPTWHTNCTALLGDACHAMLPYVAQGAAQAIEDAAVLATCLMRSATVPLALSIYEELRKPRAEFVQSCAHNVRRVLHLPDGPEQEQRDREMRAEQGAGWKHPDLWSDPSFQDKVWGYDAVKTAETRCDTTGMCRAQYNTTLLNETSAQEIPSRAKTKV